MRLTPPPFTLRQLQYVVAIADARSFRRAAEACHVSQPSLSSQVAAVEEAIGLRIFDRGRSGVLLTSAGEAFVLRARELLVAADDLSDAALRLADPFSGTLRLGVIPTISPYLLPDVAPALRRGLPRLRITWTEDKTPVLVAALHAGDLDGILVALEADLGDVESAVISRDAFVLATSREHPLAKSSAPLRLASVDTAGLLLLAEGHCLRDQALRACGTSGRGSSVASGHPSGLAATSLPTLVRMVAAGEGVTLLPELSLAVENRRRDLRLRRFRSPEPGRTIVLAWRRGAASAACNTRVAELIKSAYPGGRGGNDSKS